MRVLHLLTASTLLPALALAAWAASPVPPNSAAKFAASKTPAKAAAHAIASAVSFRDVIEPLLKTSCTTCHNAATHTSGFNLEAVDALFRGGSKFGGKVIVPGNAKSSVLVAYLRGAVQPRMPMGGEAIPEAQIRAVETWINQGARIDAVRLGWPYTPPAAQKIPTVKNAAWTRGPIDNFVLARLEAKGLKPAAPANKITLLRRVYADLIGLPPSPQEASAFLADASPNAYPDLIDRLLADPRYGERWARHWLDLVRYADSDGFENDGARPRAWRFRDYAIRAFNQDKPYDRFLKEQIAGDELYPDDADAITATGYARLAPWDSLSTDHAQRRQDFLNDVTDTTGSVMLGLTVGCAKCHNHKYDRITQADYYRMQAFFTPLKWQDTPLPNTNADPPALKQKLIEARAHLSPLQSELKTLWDTNRALIVADKQKGAKPGDKVNVSDEEIEAGVRKTQSARYDDLRGQIDHWERETAPLEPSAEAVTDERNPPVTHVLLRGSLLTPGPDALPGYMASLCGGEATPAVITQPAQTKTTGRRAALAQWIASPANPMTARVMVNRIWQHHFGRGLVATPSDFGRNGDKPTHPELLDWLANQFVSGGWSVKKMHRLMLLSNTYQQATQANAVNVKADPTNRLLWRMNRIRLEGESLRDSILFVSGRLNPTGGGPGVYPKLSEEVLATGSTHKWGTSSEEDGRRRTIYVFNRRSLALPIVETFDGPNMVDSCPRRATTTIAPQALALFNGDFSREESRRFAERVTKEAGDDPARQITTAYQLALVRRPTPAQQTLALVFLQTQTRLHLQDGRTNGPGRARSIADRPNQNAAPDVKTQQAALADLCHILLNTNEFLYLD